MAADKGEFVFCECRGAHTEKSRSGVLCWWERKSNRRIDYCFGCNSLLTVKDGVPKATPMVSKEEAEAMAEEAYWQGLYSEGDIP